MSLEHASAAAEDADLVIATSCASSVGVGRGPCSCGPSALLPLLPPTPREFAADTATTAATASAEAVATRAARRFRGAPRDGGAPRRRDTLSDVSSIRKYVPDSSLGPAHSASSPSVSCLCARKKTTRRRGDWWAVPNLHTCTFHFRYGLASRRVAVAAPPPRANEISSAPQSSRP